MEKDIAQIPYVVYEGTQARNERTTKRLVSVIVLTVLLLFISNGLWLYAWMQYDYTGSDTTYSQDGSGYNNINTGEQGDIANGASVDDSSKNETAKESQ